MAKNVNSRKSSSAKAADAKKTTYYQPSHTGIKTSNYFSSKAKKEQKLTSNRIKGEFERNLKARKLVNASLLPFNLPTNKLHKLIDDASSLGESAVVNAGTIAKDSFNLGDTTAIRKILNFPALYRITLSFKVEGTPYRAEYVVFDRAEDDRDLDFSISDTVNANVRMCVYLLNDKNKPMAVYQLGELTSTSRRPKSTVEQYAPFFFFANISGSNPYANEKKTQEYLLNAFFYVQDLMLNRPTVVREIDLKPAPIAEQPTSYKPSSGFIVNTRTQYVYVDENGKKHETHDIYPKRAYSRRTLCYQVRSYSYPVKTGRILPNGEEETEMRAVKSHWKGPLKDDKNARQEWLRTHAYVI